MRKGTKAVVPERPFLLLLHFSPQGPMDAYLLEGKERERGSRRRQRNLLLLQTTATCRENESECTGKVGLFITVHLRAMQSITSLQSMTFPLCWPLLLLQVSWPPSPRSLMAECELYLPERRAY